jgi:hypothetical protein
LFSVRGPRHDFAVIACDEDGLAFWGTSRRLPFDPAIHKTKYVLLSSSRGSDPSVSGQPKYHVAGMRFPPDKVFVTEGVVKAEYISWKLNVRCVGLYSAGLDAPTQAEVERLARTWQPCL